MGLAKNKAPQGFFTTVVLPGGGEINHNQPDAGCGQFRLEVGIIVDRANAHFDAVVNLWVTGGVYEDGWTQIIS